MRYDHGMLDADIVPANSPGLKWEYFFELSDAQRNTLSGRDERTAFRDCSRRAKVPGGWFVHLYFQKATFFYPDPDHEWDGSSLP